MSKPLKQCKLQLVTPETSSLWPTLTVTPRSSRSSMHCCLTEAGTAVKTPSKAQLNVELWQLLWPWRPALQQQARRASRTQIMNGFPVWLWIPIFQTLGTGRLPRQSHRPGPSRLLSKLGRPWNSLDKNNSFSSLQSLNYAGEHLESSQYCLTYPTYCWSNLR